MPFFPGKSIFSQIWEKMPQNTFFWIFWNIFLLVFPGNNPKWKLVLLLIFYCQSHIWKNSGSWVMGEICYQLIKLKDSLKCNRVKVILCYYYVTYAFQGESAVYRCLNVKELLARNRRNILSLTVTSWNWWSCQLSHLIINCYLMKQ